MKILILVFIWCNKNRSYTEKVKYPLYNRRFFKIYASVLYSCFYYRFIYTRNLRTRCSYYHIVIWVLQTQTNSIPFFKPDKRCISPYAKHSLPISVNNVKRNVNNEYSLQHLLLLFFCQYKMLEIHNAESYLPLNLQGTSPTSCGVKCKDFR